MKIELDNKKIEYLLNNFNKNDIFLNIKKLNTKEGKLNYKLKLLKLLWNNKKENMDNIINLYYELVNENIEIDEYKLIIDKIDKKLDEYDYKLYILKELGHILPPLNIWDNNEFRLEDWQLNGYNIIKNNESLIVQAPTSSGKSFLGYSVATVYKKILYICPSIPVVFQVAANFIKMI